MVIIMKSLIVYSGGKRASSYSLALLAILMISTIGTAWAAEFSITKAEAPGPVLVLSNSNTDPGVGFSKFSILYPDIPAGTLNDPKQLLEIRWSTTYYPGTLNDEVRLCYYRPFSSQENCEQVYPNSSGVLMGFNDQAFGHGSKVMIYHKVLGGTPPYARPAGVDSVTFKYRY